MKKITWSDETGLSDGAVKILGKPVALFSLSQRNSDGMWVLDSHLPGVGRYGRYPFRDEAKQAAEDLLNTYAKALL